MQDTHSPTTAVIIFTPSDDEGSQAFREHALSVAYQSFSTLAQDNGLTLYRSSTRWYEPMERCFKLAWHWTGTTWELKHNIRPGVIYDKASNTPEIRAVKESLQQTFPFINSLEFSDHAGSKFLVSQTFSQFSKPYYRVESSDELTTALSQLPGSIVVIKPEQGNSGDGIFILEKERCAALNITYPFLIQEFVDSSAGIPGIMKGLHDLRLIYSDEELVYTYYRTPKSGSYLANLAQGGTQTMINPDDLPASINPIVEAIQSHYSKFQHKIYTIDLIFDQAGVPWIVELNTMPGLYPDESERPYIEKLYRAIIRVLKEVSVPTPPSQ